MVKLAKLKHPKLDAKTYGECAQAKQSELMLLQQAIYKTGKKIVLAIEGTDSAGKGGMIKRLTEYMDPRGVQVFPIGAPSPEEISQHYMQRFWQRLPQPGHIAIFDRSWYGRVLIERVEKLTPKQDWSRAYDQINQFEKTLIDDDIIVIKLFLTIDKNEQKRRLIARLNNPDKYWKITPADITSREYWAAYQRAYQDMLERCNTKHAPWHVVAANSKHYARLACMDVVLTELRQHINLKKIELIDQDFRREALVKLST